MGRPVICKFCGKQLYKEREDYQKIGNRYAHLKCFEFEQDRLAKRKEVTDLIQRLYYPMKPDWAAIGSQLKRYIDEGMTYEGIYKAIEYFFVIQKNDIKTSTGIGIVPYVYNKAKSYYKNINNTYTQKAKIQEIKDLGVNNTQSTITITHNKPKKKFIDFNYE